VLTGFDAPIAQVMYIDRNLKDHTLMQAIARVNRTYKGKQAGLGSTPILRTLQKSLIIGKN